MISVDRAERVLAIRTKRKSMATKTDAVSRTKSSQDSVPLLKTEQRVKNSYRQTVSHVVLTQGPRIQAA